VKWGVNEGVRMAVNPGALEIAKGRRLLRILKQVDVVLLNRHEAESLFGQTDTEAIFQSARAAGLHTVVVTNSDKGADILDGSYMYSTGVYKPVAVVDRTGAGYAYGAGLIAAIAKGRSMQQAMSFAAANATSVISYLGARVGILSNMDVDIMKVTIRVFHEEDHDTSH
jgi:sugar/nucleoside kinase (ribokinase family)